MIKLSLLKILYLGLRKSRFWNITDPRGSNYIYKLSCALRHLTPATSLSRVERSMERFGVRTPLVILSLLLFSPVVVHGWGEDGHVSVCRIAQARLSEAAAAAVKKLLPESANEDLASLCLWPDLIRRQPEYLWSASLHFVNTPGVCNYDYSRDCKDVYGEKERCIVAAINNYTTQLLTYDKPNSQYNLTEALLFLSHFFGDIHQPLHCGFVSDKGGNAIRVHWYTKETNLHRVWDDDIIGVSEERTYNSVQGFVDAIQKNITGEWADEVVAWETCVGNKTTCPDTYASESVKSACNWAYKGVSQGSKLADEYYYTRSPIVNLRIAQGGVRLAATLNRIFGEKQTEPLAVSGENKAVSI
ncbi:hypothetical protein NMG60_11020499 [Bertholletia excelsa]